MEIEKKLCLECGSGIKGRTDKKFCSDACRNLFNNKQKSDQTNHMRNVNNILRKNRKILESLNPEGTAKVSKEKLTKKGFDFQYFTSVYTTQKGATYFYCYEYGYLPIENQYYFLVKKKEE